MEGTWRNWNPFKHAKREESILPSVEHGRHLAAAHVICNIMEPPLRVYVNSHFPVNNVLRIRTREEIL